MSSNRQPRQSGGAGPHHSKPAMITVEEWERKASLNELEARSVHFVKSASGGGGARLPPQAQVRERKNKSKESTQPTYVLNF
jgi:hypothetical protein